MHTIKQLLVWAITLARHDALFVFAYTPMPRVVVVLLSLCWGRRQYPRRREGERLCDALVALGPSFIKLGQVLSVRPDFVGEAMASDLAALHDRLPAFSVTDELLASYFEQPVATLFASFDYAPIAAASIAQVHRAVTVRGDQVAVKLIRPGIRARFARDEKFLRRIATVLDRRGGRIIRKLHLTEVVDTWRKWTREETNMRLEAAAADLLRRNLAGEEKFRIPKIYWISSSQDALVLEWIDGVKITDTATLQRMGIDSEALLQRAIEVFFLQVFRDGFFHADIHPGNLLVTRDGTIVPVDFGIMGRLSKEMRYYLADMLAGFVERDYDRVARIHLRAGFVPPQTSVDEFALACRAIGEPLFGIDLDKASFAKMLLQIISITPQFHIEVQVQLLLLQKTMIQAEGLGRLIAPNCNVWRLVYPLASAWLRQNRRPDRLVREMMAARLSTLIQGLGEKWGEGVGEGLGEEIEARIGQAMSAVLHTPAPLAPSPRRADRGIQWAVVALLGVMVGFALANL
ncbi:MAG: 2-polyprenylphenol 6-hydroxylase [Alphaproteobacteria bacterium]|nr:2-polyprenylphenol 6-hydroxylase [Alphaproteobacteria bacterium]